MGIPKKPIIPAVVNKGKRFGINETNTILTEENNTDIKEAIRIIASVKLVNKLSTK